MVEYTPEYPESAWSYLKTGALVHAKEAGLVSYAEPNEDLQLRDRA